MLVSFQQPSWAPGFYSYHSHLQHDGPASALEHPLQVGSQKLVQCILVLQVHILLLYFFSFSINGDNLNAT